MPRLGSLAGIVRLASVVVELLVDAGRAERAAEHQLEHAARPRLEDHRRARDGDRAEGGRIVVDADAGREVDPPGGRAVEDQVAGAEGEGRGRVEVTDGGARAARGRGLEALRGAGVAEHLHLRVVLGLAAHGQADLLDGRVGDARLEAAPGAVVVLHVGRVRRRDRRGTRRGTCSGSRGSGS